MVGAAVLLKDLEAEAILLLRGLGGELLESGDAGRNACGHEIDVRDHVNRVLSRGERGQKQRNNGEENVHGAIVSETGERNPASPPTA